MITRQDFKQTELGKIPIDWDILTLRDIGELRYGYTSTSTKSNIGIKYLRISDISERGKIVWVSIPYCKISENDYRKYRLQKGDVLFARIGASTGKTAFFDKNEKAVFASYLIKLTPISKTIIPEFISYFCQSRAYWVQVHKNREGQLKKGLNAKILGHLKIALPPLPEQKKIAEILSIMDQAIEKVGQGIEKTQRLKKGLMQELLTRGIGHIEFKKTEIGQIPKVWDIRKLSDLAYVNKESINAERELGNNKFSYIDIDSVENETGLIKDPKEIMGKTAPSRARRTIHQDDVIMSTVRPYLKAFAIIPARYEGQICSTGFAVFTCKQGLYPAYLFNVLFSKEFINQCNRMMVGAQYPALSSSQVSKLKIPCPPVKEQQKIGEILGSVDRRLGSLRARIKALERIKKGLMEDLLTGTKRLKTEA